ncbi:hypothetical protein I6G56_10115 [Burkholderia humptydooensis]|uniref:Uncharacterized protein n=1 Tax=Burkholderia humptydooensis TaxID=430531 RepID=A0A7T2U4H2_9BURK|nr:MULTISPECIES: hypothetical protein [Burkholderia]QPS45378.1 hypothetical protein I6G56_10115 [Burkholderia humptydooensis]
MNAPLQIFLRCAQQRDARDVDADDCARWTRVGDVRVGDVRVGDIANRRTSRRFSAPNIEITMPTSSRIAQRLLRFARRIRERPVAMRKRPLVAGVVVQSNWG